MLWLYRIPMCLSMLATRCAISIFFIRTLYTKIFPRLRRIGTNHCKAIPFSHYNGLIDEPCSVLLHLSSYCPVRHYDCRNITTLPASKVELDPAAQTIRVLLQRQAVLHHNSGSWHCHRLHHMDATSLGSLETTAPPSPQSCNHGYLRCWHTVR